MGAPAHDEFEAKCNDRLARPPGVWQHSTLIPETPMSSRQKLILASGSPRRRELLAQAGLAFDLAESGVEELRAPGEDARDYALRMARAKAAAVSRLDREAIVIGADTVVQCAGEILEKPKDAADAHRMLRTLSGRGHVVVTAFAIARGGEVVESEAVESRVFFRPLTDEEIRDYVSSGEPFDKAGAYGIQGRGGEFIARVDGPTDNVMGLPVSSVLDGLRRAGVKV